ncbi:MAG: hypothetical protein MI922_25080 [Bacteroidales bacterium]|nr:hypothetical protein [Bacteroidales bacterium]
MKFYTIIFLGLIIILKANSQELTVIYPLGFASGEIKLIDTLDALVMENDKFLLKPTKVIKSYVKNDAKDEIVPVYTYQSNLNPIALFKNHSFKRDNIQGEFLNSRFLAPNTSTIVTISNNMFQRQRMKLCDRCKHSGPPAPGRRPRRHAAVEKSCIAMGQNNSKLGSPNDCYYMLVI